jgi:hypothetical protein
MKINHGGTEITENLVSLNILRLRSKTINPSVLYSLRVLRASVVK